MAARVGGKKVHDFHFKATQEEGDRFLAVVNRLGEGRADVARQAVLLLVTIAEKAPDLTSHRLAVFIEDTIAPIVAPTAPAAPSSTPPAKPVGSRTRPQR